jgi:hypothetical protein
MITVETESGSVYVFKDDLSAVQRVESTHELRGDGDWLELEAVPHITVGAPMFLALEPLSDEAVVTYRTTSPVTAIRP